MFQRYLSYIKPTTFMILSSSFIRIFEYIWGPLLFAGFFLGLFLAPEDIQQGENYRIIYIHVPSAWMSLMMYLLLAFSSCLYLIYKHPITFYIGKAFCLIGLCYTGITLVTGSLWGFPMWGTYWVWDARLTSVLVLFFLYLGYVVLIRNADSKGIIMGSILSVIGLINIPIIKFSVNWWNTLHQPASITQYGGSIHVSMLIPIFLIVCGFVFYSSWLCMLEIRKYIIYKKISVLYYKLIKK